MSERLTRDEVVHVARLARLELTDDEIDRFTRQLGDVLDHAADIEALDVGDIAPTAHPIPLVNVMRDYGYVDPRGMGVRNKIIPGMQAHNGTEPDLIEEESRVVVRLWKEARP